MQNRFFGGQAELFAFERHTDNRGELIPFNFNDLPFEPRRSFIVADVPVGEARGQHALRSGTQLFICLQGQIEILMRYKNEETSLMLNPTSSGLIIYPGVWSQQTYVDEKSILLAFADEPYDPNAYIT